jgi:serine/threonine protein phosphatase 1
MHSKQFTQKIQKNKARRFAISDIHGCGKTFIYLVEEILQLTKDDQLFVLGDLIDRGKNPILLIDYIIEKQKEGFQIFVLIGNHEQMLLDRYASDGNMFYRGALAIDYLEGLVDERTIIKEKYVKFFEEMLFYIELENCFLVHAGFDVDYEFVKIQNIFTNKEAMVWIRDFKGNLERTKQKPVVHGHVVHNLEQIKESLELAKQKKAAVIPIDNGCAYKDKGKTQKNNGEIGNLCAVELTENENTWTLFYTPFREENIN